MAADPEFAAYRGPRRRDLTKPQKGSPSTCRAGAMHILALQPNRTSRSELRHDEPAVGVSYALSARSNRAGVTQLAERQPSGEAQA